MAYILGFISADGSINKQRTSLSIELQMRDIEILEFIREKISPNSPIKITKKKGKEYCRLRINSVNLVKSLEKFNVVPNKTHIIRLNFEITKEYFGDYLRGLFDGDGWVICRRNTIEFGICSGSENYLDDIKNKLGCGRTRVKIKNKKLVTYVLDAESKSAIIIRDIMYASNTFSLKRKKDIFFSEFHIPSKRWWTEEQIKYLKDNYKYNESPQIIADAIGKSYKAISKKIWELKLTN